jgi:hypothetical protein
MNIYDVQEIELQIDRIAESNDGEIPEDLLQELIIAQTSSIVQVEKLCRYIKHLEAFDTMADMEIARISNLKARANNRMASIKKYLTPFVKERGKFDAGTFRLSTRKSTRVEVDQGFNDPAYMVEKTSVSPDKVKIKDALTSGTQLPGARLVESDNLQIK